MKLDPHICLTPQSHFFNSPYRAQPGGFGPGLGSWEVGRFARWGMRKLNESMNTVIVCKPPTPPRPTHTQGVFKCTKFHNNYNSYTLHSLMILVWIIILVLIMCLLNQQLIIKQLLKVKGP